MEMWEKEQAGALRERIEALLSALPESAGLRGIIEEALCDSDQGPGCNRDKAHPWSLLPLLVSRAVTGDSRKGLLLAASMVFFKAAAEVFDDVEDADSSRSISARYGSAVAVNTATTLLMLAEKALSGLAAEGADNHSAVHVIDLVNSYYLAACAGQHRELARPPARLVSEKEYLEITAVKSAFAVECACRAGALLAGGDEKMVDIFTDFGRELGLAAQMANDIRGINSGVDIARAKLTFPVVYALGQTDGKIRRELEARFLDKDNRTAPPADRLKELIFQCGAVHYTAVKMEYYKQLAGKALSRAKAAGADTGQLETFIG